MQLECGRHPSSGYGLACIACAMKQLCSGYVAHALNPRVILKSGLFSHISWKSCDSDLSNQHPNHASKSAELIAKIQIIYFAMSQAQGIVPDYQMFLFSEPQRGGVASLTNPKWRVSRFGHLVAMNCSLRLKGSEDKKGDGGLKMR